MLSDCRTCQFSSRETLHDSFGCAVQPYYWALWQQLQRLPREVVSKYPIDRCQDYQEQEPVPFSTLVDNTRWLVAVGAEQRNHHSVPWQFSADGVVRAVDLWQGTWQAIPDQPRAIEVEIVIFSSGKVDRFSVVFDLSGDYFTAFKNDCIYRSGKRT